MLAKVELNGIHYQANLLKPIDISIPIGESDKAVKAWYVGNPEIQPVKGDGFIGAVALGGSVNFRDIKFNPHGNGTHTECVGHITKKVHSINKHLNQFFFKSQVISVLPEMQSEDLVITKKQIEKIGIANEIEALILRTLPNENKLFKDYSNTNPPYLEAEAMQYIADSGINHFLIDLPSVDKEVDGGSLTAHNIFWNTMGEIRFDATITEFIFVENEVEDGFYLLNLQVAAFENDASPSRPVLFKLV